MERNIIIQNAVRFVLLMLFQLLILNNVNCSGYAIPYIYILFIIMLPTDTNRLLMLVLGFITGLTMDIFCNMLGFHTFSCVLIAMARIVFADHMMTKNAGEVIATPSIYSVKPQVFIGYSMTLTALFYTAFFTLELFGVRGFGKLLLTVLLSTLFTTILSLTAQIVFMKRKNR